MHRASKYPISDPLGRKTKRGGGREPGRDPGDHSKNTKARSPRSGKKKREGGKKKKANVRSNSTEKNLNDRKKIKTNFKNTMWIMKKSIK